MQLFKPLQRNCVSSTEILHESTIARFYKQLEEEEAANKLADEFTPPARKKLLAENFYQTSQLLINRHERHQAKLIVTKELDSEVVTDLRKIDEHGDDEILIEDFSRTPTITNENFKYAGDLSPTPSRSSVDESTQSTDWISPAKPSFLKQRTFERNMIPESVLERDDESCSSDVSKVSTLLAPEPHPQGRYSPRSGTFHYPDLFMESLTKSPKFKSTSTSISEVVGELIARKPVEVPSYTAEESISTLLSKTNVGNMSTKSNYDPEHSRTGQSSDTNSRSSASLGDIFDEDRVEENESWKEDGSTSQNSSEEELSNDDCDSDEYEIDDETDTYHPSDSAPLSFEQALAISNPKRSVSPTSDMFLESETPFYDDENERDFGLHYFNKNYAEWDQDHQRRENVSGRDEEKVPKSILKPNIDSTWNDSTYDQNRMSLHQRQNHNRSLKKQVRIEEPYKEEETVATARATDDNDTSLVIINHYSDIVKQYGNVQKPTTKVYLTYEELKAAAQMAELENKEEEFIDRQLRHQRTFNQEIPEVGVNADELESATATSESATATSDTKVRIVHQRVHFFFNFFLDSIMFAFACWLFFFKDEKLAIPIIVLMVYRQLYDKIKKKVGRYGFWRREDIK